MTRDKELSIVRGACLLLGRDFIVEQGRSRSITLKKIIGIGRFGTEARNECNLVSSVFRATCRKKIVMVSLLAPFLCGLLFPAHSGVVDFASKYALGTRCLIPNSYPVWEFTRPLSDCEFCKGVRSALVLRGNLTREEFEPYAYTSRPVVVINAASHWPARNVFSLLFFKTLYDSIDGAYESVDEECQFLHFKSNLASLREVFSMGERRASHMPGEEAWYVGWKNCHPHVLEIMKKFYETPHFLPEDAEIPHTNYVFLGYERGAIMHLDYIPRLMWQGQVLGRKTWSVAPTPECDHVCETFDFSVGPGDVVLLDTRIWYHSTYVESGQFSLTVTSEYG